MRKVVYTSEAPQPKRIHSLAIAAGFVFVAGQTCVNPEANEFEFGDVQLEIRRTLQEGTASRASARGAGNQ
jgi:enamine deaminase RidA (YjgF/YER057c/UK114 family)